MGQKTKQQLEVINNQNFPNNNSAFITPEKLRNFNVDIIDSMVVDVDSGLSGSISITGSLVVTDSVTADVYFGDGSNLTGVIATVPAGTVSGSSQLTASYDQRYQLSGSDAPLPSGLVSGSSQVDVQQTLNFGSINQYSDSKVKDKLNLDSVLSGSLVNQLPSGVVSGSSQLTASYDTRYELSGSIISLPSGVVSGSSQVSYTGLSNIPSGIVSSSSQVSNLTGSLLTTASVSNSTISLTKGDGSSFNITVNNIESASFADNSTSSSHALVSDTVLDTNIAYQNQNNGFSGNQTFNDITVNGTGSFAQINFVTGSATIIGDAFIVLNADTPTLRYAGIKVFDTGSQATASLEWDGDTDNWLVVDEQGNTAFLLYGPTGSRGGEVSLTPNTLTKGGADNGLVNSSITDNGTLVSINANVTATGFVGNDLVSGSDQLTGSLDTRYELSGSVQPLPSGVVSGSSQIDYTGLTNIPVGIVSGSSQLTASYDTRYELSGSVQPLPSGVVSGSSQITELGFLTTSSFNDYTSSVTESIVTAIVTNNGSNYYIIDGIDQPILSFVPGLTYRFDLSGIAGNHPFKFSESPNGPTQYTTGVTSGSGFIQIEIGYNTASPLYYYCTNHNGMGNEINVLAISKLATTGSNTFEGNQTINGSAVQNFTAPELNNEVQFVNVSGANIGGRAYNRVASSFSNFAGAGLPFEDYFGIEYFDGFGYNFGSEFNINGKQTNLFTIASGSGQQSFIRTTDNYDGTSQVTLSSGNKISVSGRIEADNDLDLTGNLVVDGDNLFNGSTTISGSVLTEVAVQGITSTTASIDFSNTSLFELTLASGVDTHIDATNVGKGQTVNLLITQDDTTAGTVSFSPKFLQPSGSSYTPTDTYEGQDILTLMTYNDTNKIYVVATNKFV